MEKLIRYAGTATGRVQGVGFRMFVQQRAMERHITGWVKNMDDGSVSMELQGTEGAVEGLERLIRTGNYFIRVKTFSLEACAVCPDEKRFVIRY